MAIVNRDLDSSQQVDALQISVGAVAVTKLVPLAVMPYPCTIQTIKYAAVGCSGNPIWTLGKQSVGTTVAIGISGMVLQNVGVSGSVGFSGLAAVGSTLLNFNAGDVLYAVTSGANTALEGILIELAVKKTQDIVSYN